MPDYTDEDAAYDAAVKAEWGVYVADGPIYIGGALAFTDGSAVPVSTVDRFELVAGGYVRKADEPKQEKVTVAAAPPAGDPVLINAETTPPPVAQESDVVPDVPVDPPAKTK